MARRHGRGGRARLCKHLLWAHHCVCCCVQVARSVDNKDVGALLAVSRDGVFAYSRSARKDDHAVVQWRVDTGEVPVTLTRQCS